MPRLINRIFGRATDWVLVPIIRRRLRRLSRSMLENTLKAKLKLAGALVAGAVVFTLACRLAGLHMNVTHVYLIVAIPAITAIKVSAGVAKLRDPIPKPTAKDGLGKRIGFAVFMRLPKSLRLAVIKKVAKTAVKTAVTDPLTLGFVAGYILLLVVWKVAIRFAAQ